MLTIFFLRRRDGTSIRAQSKELSERSLGIVLALMVWNPDAAATKPKSYF